MHLESTRFTNIRAILEMPGRKSKIMQALLFIGRHQNWKEVSRKTTAFASKVHLDCHSASCWVTTPALRSSSMALSSYLRTSLRMCVVCCPSKGGGLASDILNLLYLTAGPVKGGGKQEAC